MFVGAGTCTLATNTNHRLRIMADRFNAPVEALSVNTNGTCTFGTDIQVAGTVGCTDLRVDNSIVALTMKAPSNASLTLGEATGATMNTA